MVYTIMYRLLIQMLFDYSLLLKGLKNIRTAYTFIEIKYLIPK